MPVTVGDVTSTVDPEHGGPGRRLDGHDRPGRAPAAQPDHADASFFTTREVGVVTKVDPAALDAALTELKPAVDKPAVEGTVRFDGVTPQPRSSPSTGSSSTCPRRGRRSTRDWASARRSRCRSSGSAPDHDARRRHRGARRRSPSPPCPAPVTVTGENGTSATLTPQDIAAALSFRADPDGRASSPELNQDVDHQGAPAAARRVRDRPAGTRRSTSPAAAPVVVPSQDGRGVDYDATLKDLLAVLTSTGDQRQITAVYGDQPAKLTTEELNGLGHHRRHRRVHHPRVRRGLGHATSSGPPSRSTA